jgi:hypothetical protein
MKPTALVLLYTGLTVAPLFCGVPTSVAGKEPVALTLVPAVPVAERSHFRISAGAAYRSLGGVEFFTGSQSGRLKLPFLALATARKYSQVGNASEIGERDYYDGHVHQDGGTPEDGLTWNWGYQDASQLSGDTLSYRGQGNSVTDGSRNRTDTAPGSWDVDGDGVVPMIQLDWEYDLRPNLAVGLSLQYSLLGFDGRNQSQTFSASQRQISREVNVIDYYDVSEIIVPLAPYQSSYDGPGPLIDNRPFARTHHPGHVLEQSDVRFYNRIEESLDVQLHNLSFGPTISTKVGAVSLSLGGGVSLNIADWSATHTETLYVKRDRKAPRIYQRWSNRENNTSVLTGAYLQFAATVPITKKISLTAFGNHDWSQALEGTVGPSHFRVDPTGWTLGAMLGYSF